MNGDRGSSEDADGRVTTAERRRRLVFHSASLAEPFPELREASVTVDSVVQLPDGATLQYWTVEHGEPQRFVEAVRGFPTVLDAELLRTVDGTHRFEVRGTQESVFAAFSDFDGVTRSATYDADGVHVVAEVPADVETDRVLEAVQERHVDFELVDSVTVETLDAFRHLVSERLTERQLTVLQLSYFGGYYEQPRQRTGAELAERLGISKQAYHDHLRKAHAAVFEALFDGANDAILADM